jgi:hypothetical protein
MCVDLAVLNIKTREKEVETKYCTRKQRILKILRLQHQREAAEESARQSEHAKGLSKRQCRCSCCAGIRGVAEVVGGAALRAAAGGLFRRAAVPGGGCAAAEAGVDGAAARVGGGAGLAGSAAGARGHGAADGGGVGLDGVLGTAGVVLSAGRRAGVVAVAAGHALVAPLLADEEGHCLGVLGDVRAEAVAALAGEAKGVGVAGVVVCCECLGRRLQADQLWAESVSGLLLQ